MARAIPVLLTVAALAFGLGTGPAAAAFLSPTSPDGPDVVSGIDPAPGSDVDPEDTPGPADPVPEVSPTPKVSSTPKTGPTPKTGLTPTVGPTPKVSSTPRSNPARGPASTGRQAPQSDKKTAAEPALVEDAIMADDAILAAGTISADDAETQATLVDVEDQRIVQTRAALTAMLQTGGVQAAQRKQPQVFASAHGRTLVLPARSTDTPYTLKDLAAVEKGRYLRRLKDGSYLLGVHVFVADGARLQLRGPLTLRMGSLPGSFSSIVAFGGNIEIKGTAKRPVQITSWDVRTKKPDLNTTDGRAYIRAVGGEFEMAYTQVSHLGFWSGRTGGIALTGTERPASAYRHRTKDQRHQDKRERLANTQADRGGNSFGDVETIPVGPGTASHVLADELVSGSIQHSVITGDAYGLFVSGSNQTQIIDNRIVDSLVHGVFMHRFAKNATIEGTKVIGSGGDGFVLSRATVKVRVSDCLAEGNGRNGFTLNGSALASGPSASGESLAVYGDSSVSNSVARNNGRYGIEVLGGSRLAVQTSEVIGGDMGIVVREGASGVQISGNRLADQRRQAIALRDGATGAYVAGNTVTGTVTGVYMRDSNGTIVGNKITTLPVPKAHGITVIGDAGGSEITRNTLIGWGTSAISTARAADRLNKHNNDEDRWDDTSSFWVKAKRYVKPMNVIWAGVILLVVVSAVRSRGTVIERRRPREIRNPYALQKALGEGRPILLRHASAPDPEPVVELPSRHREPAGSTPAAGGRG
ncbi:protein TonB, links inner and outer membranes [Streptosporangium subroseum]|uniref:Protein TonB, links inner and outer membranes n=1 Tax=Streptosporangium subroseum TaxID=106412 RepID=A0A239LZZ7_9ACTN|nr:right-handed parallel beta-helix repeat-containing protein [Streptosporangium subroseum]SNT35254.1 protein TonB, links inner and outer membranes [Streptosporangium subroseum]